MSFEDERQRQVRTGQAINLSVHLAANENIGEAAEKVMERAFELVEPLQGFIAAIQDGAAERAAVHGVVTAFPGAEVEATNVTELAAYQAAGGPQVETVPQFQTHESPPSRVLFKPVPSPDPTVAQQHVAQPAPVPGATDGDPETAALWQLYFSDPTAWWDNRNDKASGKFKPGSPDFKHKDQGHALWIIGKKNPSWVAGQLAAQP